MKPTFYKVNLKPRKLDPCRVCNTKSRPNIDILANSELKLSIEDVLELQIFPDSPFSKRICVECMSLVNLMVEFKRICASTQEDLWQGVCHVRDRGPDTLDLLKRARSFELSKIDPPPLPQIQVHQAPKIDLINMKKEPLVVHNMTVLKPAKKISLIKKEVIETPAEMVEEYLDELEEPEVENRQMHNRSRKMYNCTYEGCGLRFNSQTLLGKHIKAVHMKRSDFKCPTCTMVFLDVTSLTHHRKLSHPVDKRLHKCSYCLAHFHLEQFKEHILDCQAERRRPFVMSSLQPPSKYPKLPKEVVQKKLMEDDRLYMCGICDEKFRTVKEYTSHLFVHSQVQVDEDDDMGEEQEALRNMEATLSL